jgi:hypothetical protein
VQRALEVINHVLARRIGKASKTNIKCAIITFLSESFYLLHSGIFCDKISTYEIKDSLEINITETLLYVCRVLNGFFMFFAYIRPYAGHHDNDKG